MKKLLILALNLAILSGCEAQKNKNGEGTTVISGNIENSKGANMYFESLSLEGAKLIDSVLIDDKGYFEFHFTPSEAGFFRLAYSPSNYGVLVIKDGDKINLTANADNIDASVKVTGSEETQHLHALNKILMGTYTQMEQARQQMMLAQQTQNASAYQQSVANQYRINNEMTAQLKSFIDTSLGFLTSLAALERLDFNADYDYFKKVADGLEKNYGNTSHYKSLKQRVDAMAKLAIGAQAPEISLNNPAGKSIPLSSLQGNYVLIDFWASWCGPCRKENPNVVRLYEKYHSKGFEVYSVSLDKDKTAWESAIAQDKLTWTHVSDLGFWQSSIVPVYNIESIPQTYLVDKEGKIIAKNLRGAELESKLQEIFGL